MNQHLSASNIVKHHTTFQLKWRSKMNFMQKKNCTNEARFSLLYLFYLVNDLIDLMNDSCINIKDIKLREILSQREIRKLVSKFVTNRQESELTQKLIK